MIIEKSLKKIDCVLDNNSDWDVKNVVQNSKKKWEFLRKNLKKLWQRTSFLRKNGNCSQLFIIRSIGA